MAFSLQSKTSKTLRNLEIIYSEFMKLGQVCFFSLPIPPQQFTQLQNTLTGSTTGGLALIQ